MMKLAKNERLQFEPGTKWAYSNTGMLVLGAVIEKATGERQVNAVGYCVGGTLLSMTLGYMALHGDEHRVHHVGPWDARAVPGRGARGDDQDAPP